MPEPEKAITIEICEKILESIQSHSTILSQVWTDPWTAAIQYQFYNDASEFDDLEVSVVPGSLVCENLTRDGGRVQFTVGVSIGKRLLNDSEIPLLAAFSEKLLLILQGFPSFRPASASCRGAELATISTESIYSNQTLEAVRTFDSLIVLTFNVYFKKGVIS